MNIETATHIIGSFNAGIVVLEDQGEYALVADGKVAASFNDMKAAAAEFEVRYAAKGGDWRADDSYFDFT